MANKRHCASCFKSDPKGKAHHERVVRFADGIVMDWASYDGEPVETLWRCSCCGRLSPRRVVVGCRAKRHQALLEELLAAPARPTKRGAKD